MTAEANSRTPATLTMIAGFLTVSCAALIGSRVFSRGAPAGGLRDLLQFVVFSSYLLGVPVLATVAFRRSRGLAWVRKTSLLLLLGWFAFMAYTVFFMY